MKMIIQTPNFKARKSLTNFVQAKVAKLGMLSNRILGSRIYLKLNNAENKENKVCEIKLSIPGNELFVSAQSHTFEGAVQQAVMSARNQLERWKYPQKRKFRKSDAILELQELY